MNKLFRTFLLSLSLHVMGLSVHATLLLYEGFDYPLGDSLNTKDDGFGWSAPWNQEVAGNDLVLVANGSNPVTNLVSTGLRVQKAGGGPGTGTLYSRTFDPLTFNDGDELWFSFTINGSFNSGFDNGIRFYNGGSQILYIGNDGSKTSPDRDEISIVDWQLPITRTQSTTKISSSSNFSQVMIGKITFGAANETLDLYYGGFAPVVEGGLGTSILPVMTGVPLTNFTSLDELKIDINNSATGLIDEIRMATTYSDVISKTEQVVQTSSELIVYEGFDYGLGASLAAQSGGIGWSAAWNQVTAGNDLVLVANATSPPVNLTMTGLRVQKAGGGGGSGTLYERAFNSQTFSDGDVLWFSFNIQGGFDSGFSNGLRFFNGANQVLFVGNDGNKTSPNRNEILVIDDINTLLTSTVGISSSTDTVHTMIGKITFAAGNEVLDLYYGPFVPLNESGLGVNMPTVMTGVSIANISSLDSLRIDINNSAAGFVDEIRLARNYTFVRTATSSSTLYQPTDQFEFALAASAALPGDVIELPAGTLNNWGDLDIAVSGSAGSAITVCAPSVYGTTITGDTSFNITGDYITIKGIRFENTTGTYPVHFNGSSYGEVTQCYFEGATASSYVRADPIIGILDSASYLGIIHNYFTVGPVNPITLVGLDDSGFVGNHVIEYNMFRDAASGSTSSESVNLFSEGKHNGNSLNSEVSFNVFDNWDGDPDGEIVTLKSGGNTVYRNVFAWCDGYLSLRRENDNWVEGNLFYENTQGIRIYGDSHVVINNVFEGIDQWPLAIPNGWFRVSDGIEAKAATNTLVAHNTFLGTPLRTWNFQTSSQHTADGIGILPTTNSLLNNIVESSVNTELLVRDQSGFVPANTVDTNLFFQVGGSLGPTGTNPVTSGSALLAGSGESLFLSAGSPALSAGASGSGVGFDFFNQSRNTFPDIGHHEYSSGTSPVVDPPLPPLPPDRTGYDLLPLDAAFTVFPLTVSAGEPMNLDAALSTGDIVEYSWDFDDGNTYTGTEMFIPYAWESFGVYTITLTVEDSTTATDTFQVQVVVTDPGNPRLPFIDADGDYVHAIDDPDDSDARNPFARPLDVELVKQGSDFVLRAPLSPGVTTTAAQSDDLTDWSNEFHTFGDVLVPEVGETTIPASQAPPVKPFSSWRIDKEKP